jgi:tetratricopeptide (TPR) repeat protein
MNFKFSPSDPNPLHQPREVRERHYFFEPSFVLFAFFIGIGAFELLLKFRKRIKLVAPIFILLAFTPLVSNFNSQVNRRGNYIANDFGYNMLASCDDGGVLFTNGDNDTFPLWYSQNVEDTKPAVTVANLSLLQTPWYIKQMKDIGVPISFTDYEIENILPHPVVEDGKPKRDEFISTNDFAVRDILATNAGFKFEKKLLLPIRRETLPKRYRVLFPKEMEFIHPSYYRKRLPRNYWLIMPEEYLLPSEKFAELVLKDYNGKLPIYFAGTVEKGTTRGFEHYLRVEGLVRRVISQDEKQFDIERMMPRLSTSIGAGGLHIAKTDSLLNRVYRYRSIFNPSVYKYKTSKQMMGNYAVTYLLLGASYEVMGNTQKAIETMEKGKRFKTKDVTPFIANLVRLYQKVGNYQKAKENLEELTKIRGGSSSDWYQLGLYYMQYEGDKTRALDAFQKARKADKNAPWGYGGLISYYITQGDTTKVIALLDTCFDNQELTSKIIQLYRMENRKELGGLILREWLKSHPYDTVAQKLLEDFGSK